jgi:cold shock CspA family protein
MECDQLRLFVRNQLSEPQRSRPTLAEGAKVSFDLVADRRSGKLSAGNLRGG